MTFKVGETYQSAVKGRKFRVKQKFNVENTQCLLVLMITDTCMVMFGMSSRYYPAIIEDDGKTATVLMDGAFTTIYDDDVEGEE